MEESVTYQAILKKGKAEGKLEEARKLLLLVGRKQFGEPSAEALAAVEALADVQQFEILMERLLDSASWPELPGLNGTGRRGRGRKKTS